MSPFVQSVGPVVDPLTAAAYALPLDAYPVAQEPPNIQCTQVKNVLTSGDVPAEAFYSPSANQFYCGPVQYPGLQPASSGISSGWILAAILAGGLWWLFGRHA